MKIIGVKNGNGRELPQQVYLMADSAVIKTNKPFFLPHFAQHFTAVPALVIHIDRLGKHIAPRFAHRYCKAIAPAIKVTASGIDTPQESECNSALAHSFDGALLLGDFITVTEPENINTVPVSMNVNGVETSALSLADMGIDYKEMIADLSRFFTMKMGDMIVLELGDGDTETHIGDTLSATCAGNRNLIIRVK